MSGNRYRTGLEPSVQLRINSDGVSVVGSADLSKGRVHSPDDYVVAEPSWMSKLRSFKGNVFYLPYPKPGSQGFKLSQAAWQEKHDFLVECGKRVVTKKVPIRPIDNKPGMADVRTGAEFLDECDGQCPF